MTKVKIYHNPKCSKSRETLALLQDQCEPEVVEYLKVPLAISELKNILRMLGGDISVMLRDKEMKECGVSPDLSDDAMLQSIVENPRILQRPIVVANGHAKIGRPPEQVLKLFQG